MPERLTVRPAVEADCPDIYRVHVAAVRGLPPGTEGKDGIEKWLATREPACYAEAMQEEQTLVVEQGGEIVGWGALSAGKEQITNVFVDPAHQRCGIGREIIAALEAAARRAGLARVALQATGTAIDFYRAVGYESDPPAPPGAAWALMQKPL